MVEVITVLIAHENDESVCVLDMLMITAIVVYIHGSWIWWIFCGQLSPAWQKCNFQTQHHYFYWLVF